MQPFTYFIPAEQKQALEAVSQQTGLTQSEVLRRLTDYGLQEKVLNELLPRCSGSITLRQ